MLFALQHDCRTYMEIDVYLYVPIIETNNQQALSFNISSKSSPKIKHCVIRCD